LGTPTSLLLASRNSLLLRRSQTIENSVTFLYISPQPHFDLDYIVRKPMKHRFQRYIVRTKIFSIFHTRVEYISYQTIRHYAHSNQWDWVRTDTHSDTQKWKPNMCQLHSVHLADIIM